MNIITGPDECTHHLSSLKIRFNIVLGALMDLNKMYVASRLFFDQVTVFRKI